MSIEAIVYLIILFVFLAVGGFFLYLILSFKHKVRIKELVKGRKIVKDFRARSFTDKEGISWWKLSGEKDKSKRLIPLPPEEAIELNHKGKKVAECYRTEYGEIIWIAEGGDVGDIPDEIFLDPPTEIVNQKDLTIKKQMLDQWKKRKKAEYIKDHNLITPYHSINTKQRMIYFNNIRKAEARKGFNWKEQIIPAVSIGALVMIIIAGMVFWGDLAQPALNANSQAAEIRKTDLQILEIIKELKTGQQRIEAAQNNQKPP